MLLDSDDNVCNAKVRNFEDCLSELELQMVPCNVILLHASR